MVDIVILGFWMNLFIKFFFELLFVLDLLDFVMFWCVEYLVVWVCVMWLFFIKNEVLFFVLFFCCIFFFSCFVFFLIFLLKEFFLSFLNLCGFFWNVFMCVLVVVFGGFWFFFFWYSCLLYLMKMLLLWFFNLWFIFVCFVFNFFLL